MKIEPRIPSYDGIGKSSPELAALVGASIVRIGTPVGTKQRLEGGGFAIEYRRAGSETVERVIFAFNELGMWIEG